MIRRKMLLVLTCLLALLAACRGMTVARMQLDVNDIAVKNDAIFALEELKKLSDSRVYNSLSLANITSAWLQDGIYHINTILTIDFKSDYFKSKKSVESYEIIIMKNKEDNVKSIAIDEFPVMRSPTRHHNYYNATGTLICLLTFLSEESVEKFWIEKVKDKRVLREENIRRLEIESLFFTYPPSDNEEYDIDVYEIEENINKKAILDKRSVQDLLNEVDSNDLLQERMEYSKMYRRRLDGQELNEEKEICRLKLGELYDISIHNSTIYQSDFAVFRSLKLIERSMATLQSLKHNAPHPFKTTNKSVQ